MGQRPQAPRGAGHQRRGAGGDPGSARELQRRDAEIEHKHARITALETELARLRETVDAAATVNNSVSAK